MYRTLYFNYKLKSYYFQQIKLVLGPNKSALISVIKLSCILFGSIKFLCIYYSNNVPIILKFKIEFKIYFNLIKIKIVTTFIL